MGSPKRSAKFRKSIPYDNYLKNPIGVLRKYSLDAISFNKSNYLKNLKNLIFGRNQKLYLKIPDVAEGLTKYIDDIFTLLLKKVIKDRPQWVNKTVRTLTGVFNFLSKVGFSGLVTAARNTVWNVLFTRCRNRSL